MAEMRPMVGRHLKLTEKRSERIKNTIGQDRTGQAEQRALCVLFTQPQGKDACLGLLSESQCNNPRQFVTLHTHTAPHAEKHIIPPTVFPNELLRTYLLVSQFDTLHYRYKKSKGFVMKNNLIVYWRNVYHNHRQTKQCRAVLHTHYH